MTALGISLVANIKISYFKINQDVAKDRKSYCIIVAIQLIFFKLLPVPKETTRYTIIIEDELQEASEIASRFIEIGIAAKIEYVQNPLNHKKSRSYDAVLVKFVPKLILD